MQENNFGCFNGIGRNWWLEKAMGFTPSAITTTRVGSHYTLKRDAADGFALQNGGIKRPQETKMRPGIYYRFYATLDHNKYGQDAFVGGNWWLDLDNLRVIEGWADDHGLTLAKAAAQLIVIPTEWHDCGYIGSARLNTTMKAWVGKGKPATGSVSPDSAARGSALTGGAYVPLVASPAHLEIKQYFVPGTRPLLSKVFSFRSRKRAA